MIIIIIIVLIIIIKGELILLIIRFFSFLDNFNFDLSSYSYEKLNNKSFY